MFRLLKMRVLNSPFLLSARSVRKGAIMGPSLHEANSRDRKPIGPSN